MTSFSQARWIGEEQTARGTARGRTSASNDTRSAVTFVNTHGLVDMIIMTSLSAMIKFRTVLQQNYNHDHTLFSPYVSLTVN